MSAVRTRGCQRSVDWVSPVESEQLARMEGVRELLARGEHAVVFGDRAGRDELRRDRLVVVVELVPGALVAAARRTAVLVIRSRRWQIDAGSDRVIGSPGA